MAYRKKALDLHPDRNLNDAQSATIKFAEVQAAYEVLSDPHERAWYDSHRDAILRGHDHSGDGTEPTTFRNVRLTTTDEIMALVRRFNARVPFDDEPTGFFGIVRETFEHLALEEEAAAELENIQCPDYPTFGSSDDDFEQVVKPFYTTWAEFSTKKSFSWRDKHRLSEAPDRRIRRLMEKENRKSRDDSVREFNDAVRFLVAFVRKRDPRYAYNAQTDAQRQKSLRTATAAQAARSRAANQEKIGNYDLPEWATARDDSVDNNAFSEPSEDESEVEVLECIACRKTFKSLQQLGAHERSKKHINAVQKLRHQMKQDGANLHLESETSSSPEGIKQATLATSPQTDVFKAGEGAEAVSSGEQKPTSAGTDQGLVISASPEPPPAGEDDDYVPRSVVEDRLVSSASTGETTTLPIHQPSTSLETVPGDHYPTTPVKVGKAKAKRARKAAAAALMDSDAGVRRDNSEMAGIC